MNRRALIVGGLSTAAALASGMAPLEDGQTIALGDREFCLTDIVAPSSRPDRGARAFAASFAQIALKALAHYGEAAPDMAAPTDRWGRLTGPLNWKTADGRNTTLQELLLSQGAARVAPQSAYHEFIDRCFRAEDAAREAALGLWRDKAYRIRDAAAGEWTSGFQIYRGFIRSASDRGGRIFLNFGDDFRTDFTATAPKGALRRWRSKPDIALLVGRSAEIRGLVQSINGPSIELAHEKQLRLLTA